MGQAHASLSDTDLRLFRQAILNRVDYLEHCPTARLRDDQIYRPLRRERQVWRGQPSKGSSKIASIEIQKSIQNLDKVIENLA
jgi:hypothetical protein